MHTDTKRYVRHLKIRRTPLISGRLFTSVSQNFDVLSTFCGRKYARLDVIQNNASDCVLNKDDILQTDTHLTASFPGQPG